MTPMTLDLPHRFPRPTLPPVRIRGAVVAGLLYISVHQVIELPASAQSISVTMVAPADPKLPQATQPPSELMVEPEPEPESIPGLPKETPVIIEKSKSRPRPKPKPVKRVGQSKHDVKLVESHPASPFENTAPTRPTSSTTTAATSKPVTNAASGPCTLSHNQLQYPARAQALRIEGQVEVKSDVTPDGHAGSAQTLSAKPANMSGREMRSAIRRWRYEPDKPGSGVVVNTLLKINGTTETR